MLRIFILSLVLSVSQLSASSYCLTKFQNFDALTTEQAVARLAHFYHREVLLNPNLPLALAFEKEYRDKIALLAERNSATFEEVQAWIRAYTQRDEAKIGTQELSELQHGLHEEQAQFEHVSRKTLDQLKPFIDTGLFYGAMADELSFRGALTQEERAVYLSSITPEALRDFSEAVAMRLVNRIQEVNAKKNVLAKRLQLRSDSPELQNALSLINESTSFPSPRIAEAVNLDLRTHLKEKGELLAERIQTDQIRFQNVLRSNLRLNPLEHPMIFDPIAGIAAGVAFGLFFISKVPGETVEELPFYLFTGLNFIGVGVFIGRLRSSLNVDEWDEKITPKPLPKILLEWQQRNQRTP